MPPTEWGRRASAGFAEGGGPRAGEGEAGVPPWSLPKRRRLQHLDFRGEAEGRLLTARTTRRATRGLQATPGPRTHTCHSPARLWASTAQAQRARPGRSPAASAKGLASGLPAGAREAPRASREHLSAPGEAPSSGLTRTSRSVTLSSRSQPPASGDAACGRPAAPVSTASRGRRPNRSAGVAVGALQSPKSLTLLCPDPRAPAVCHTEDHWSSGHLSRPGRSVKTQPGQEPALSEV